MLLLACGVFTAAAGLLYASAPAIVVGAAAAVVGGAMYYGVSALMSSFGFYSKSKKAEDVDDSVLAATNPMAL